MHIEKSKNWQTSHPDIFWGEIAPTDHVVQVYDNDEVFLDTLAGFAGGGLKCGDAVVIIATVEHSAALNLRLTRDGVDVPKLMQAGQYIVRDAEGCLAKFMVNGWPDESLFIDFVTELLTHVKNRNNHKIRVFGEMVAMLWAKGYQGATVRLEYLWNAFCHTEPFSLFCAYPKSGFTQDSHHSIREICSTHARIISGEKSPAMEIVHKSSL